MRRIFDKIRIDTLTGEQNFVLTLSEMNKVVAISTDDFNRWNDAVRVKNFQRITDREMDKILNGKPYTFLENIMDIKLRSIRNDIK